MTKRILFLFFILLSFSLQIEAQSEFQREWNIGVGLGPTFSNMSIVPTKTTSDLKTKSLGQFSGGLSVRYIAENHLGLIAELNYSQQGWKSEFDKGSAYTHEHKLNYLEIPFLTHIYFGSKKLLFFVNLGPKLGYLVGETDKRNAALDTWLTTYGDKGAGDVGYDLAAESYRTLAQKKLDYGIMGGLGVEFKTKVGSFALEGRYYLGLGDIYNNHNDDYYTRSANRVASVRLTYFVKAFNKTR